MTPMGGAPCNLGEKAGKKIAKEKGGGWR